MEEPLERPGLFARVKGWILPGAEEEEEEHVDGGPRVRAPLRLHQNHSYHVSVRKEIHTLDDARFAADGLKEGTQQIVNLATTKPEVRVRIIDFLSGIVYALDGSVEKLGDEVFLFAPRHAIIDLAPGSARYHSSD